MYGVFCWSTAILWKFGAFAVFVTEAWVSSQNCRRITFHLSGWQPWCFAWSNTRWWFQIFVIFIPTWGNDPFWLIFFRWVETTNQNTYHIGLFSFRLILQNVCEAGVKSEIHWGVLCNTTSLQSQIPQNLRLFVAEENASTGGQLALSWTGVMGGSWVPGWEGNDVEIT